MKAIKTTIAQSGISLYIKALIFGTLAGCTATASLLCVLSLGLIVTGALPHDYLSWIVIALCSLSAFLSGYVTARITKVKGLLCGAMSGLIMFIILLLAGLITGDGDFTYISLVKLFGLLLFGALGGIKGVNRKDKLHIK